MPIACKRSSRSVGRPRQCSLVRTLSSNVVCTHRPFAVVSFVCRRRRRKAVRRCCRRSRPIVRRCVGRVFFVTQCFIVAAHVAAAGFLNRLSSELGLLSSLSRLVLLLSKHVLFWFPFLFCLAFATNSSLSRLTLFLIAFVVFAIRNHDNAPNRRSLVRQGGGGGGPSVGVKRGFHDGPGYPQQQPPMGYPQQQQQQPSMGYQQQQQQQPMGYQQQPPPQQGLSLVAPRVVARFNDAAFGALQATAASSRSSAPTLVRRTPNLVAARD